MSTLSPTSSQPHIKTDPFADLPTATSRASGGAMSAGPSSGGLVWNNGGPMLRIEDALVETV